MNLNQSLRQCCLTALVGLLSFVPALGAQTTSTPAMGESAVVATTGFQQVSERVWAFIAEDERSANGALFVGDDEALAVDPGLTPRLAERFFTAARAITDRPIKTVVLTHWHPDHALGVVLMAEQPFTLVSTAATRRMLAGNAARLRRGIAQHISDNAERAEMEARSILLPSGVLTERTFFDLGSLTIECFPAGPAHTAGDLVLWAASERVLVTGDLFLNGSCPDMEEGSFSGLLESVDSLLGLGAKQVIPGHFAVGNLSDLRRYREYLGALDARVRAEMVAGVRAEALTAGGVAEMFADFREFPQYRATFADNARAVGRQYASEPAEAGDANGFRIVKRLKVGQHPHQIAFSPSGKKAYIAVAGSDLIARVDTTTLEPAGTQAVGKTPLGVTVLADGVIAYTQFGSTKIQGLRWGDEAAASNLEIGEGPSLFEQGADVTHLLIAVERADRLVVLDGSATETLRSYPTGKRPFPPSETTDGRLAFVPNYDDGTVTVIDLWNERILDTVDVGPHPSGGDVLPGDLEYAVAVRNDNKIAIINTASREVVSTITEGIGESPFSLVVGPFGRLGYVNNTASHDVSVILLAEERVIARIPTGELPIVMAVHPSGKTLWVSCEGTDEVDVIAIPEEWQAERETALQEEQKITEIAVMGMIHGQHRTSESWGLEQVRETIRSYRPDVILPEIPPDRWKRIWSDFSARGVIEDSRVKVFPEYVDVMLPLMIELGFGVEPCAAWTKEMSDSRRARMQAFNSAEEYAEARAEYKAAEKALSAADTEHLTNSDDPLVIHSEAYDAAMAKELEPYDHYLNDVIGPGGWTEINQGHYDLIAAAIDRHPGERLLVTFGAGHKYWILRELQKRSDIRIIDIREYLPGR